MNSIRILTATSALMCLAALASCSRSDGTASGAGRVKFECGVTDDMAVSRAAISQELIPAAEDFALSITGADCDCQWKRLGDFDSETEFFPVGDYNAAISHGDIAAEGYDLPAFAGEASFRIHPNRTEYVTITAALANSMLVIETTEAFKGYFPQARFTVTTEAGNEFVVENASTQPLYVAPAGVSIAAEATKQPAQSGSAGTTVALPVQSIDALVARTCHTVTYDVSTAGSTSISILLDDTPLGSVEIEAELNDNAIE